MVGLPLQLTRALGQLFFWNLSSSRLAQHGRSQRGAVKSNRVNHFLCLWCPHLRRKDCVDALGRTTVGSGQFPINSTLRCPITSRGSILACVSCRTGSQQSQQMGACRCGPAPLSSCYFTIGALVASLVFPKSILFCFKRDIKIRSLRSSSPPNLG